MTKAIPSRLDFRNTNSLWGGVLVETLHRLGLRDAVISPGSRSTPLTMALARHPGIASIPVLDERSAAFFALGLAKRTQRPVVLVCTSGTAGANYYPAVIEAQESGVPLLVITADRPPEMRDCRSGQTIDQAGLYGGHVNFFHELAVPEPTLPMLRYLRQTVVHAWERTLWPDAGPVHLNAPFRDPLPPLADGSTKAIRANWNDEAFFATVRPPQRILSRIEASGFPVNKRGVIVVGPIDGAPSPVEAGILAGLAYNLGWPVLADGLSGLRGDAERYPGMITRYDAILRSGRAARQLTPEVVLGIGGWPTSKVLRSWLESSGVEAWLVSPRRSNQDPLHLATRHLRCSLWAFAEVVKTSQSHDEAYLDAWQRAEFAAARSLDRKLDRTGWLFEGRAAHELSRHLPAGTPVFVANSMPVRDVEYFWNAGDLGHPLYFNRGANGIDGTLSTALGLAHADRPAVLLTGDLALLHDSNGFLIRPKFRRGLTIVLINNHGGGIFEHLPVAAFDPPFEEFFATPQAVDVGMLCRAHGVEFVRVRDWSRFARLARALPKEGVRVLELRTDRKRDAALRKRLFSEAADAAEAALA
ncbi:MAG TPA: 2-succinyl-5-enolpyruvyl-6-hydroxy-3-cyclohexene-1-carboxylic-acid synthase [Lacunisphaera sp.]|nr:2-succinyl-5-enolpyruvyl-6-hydroxy-3-cyclohexene-1-carboxylic-acid synthase [Lacunisphaera sp.]